VKVVIAGGTGALGRRLAAALRALVARQFSVEALAAQARAVLAALPRRG